MRVAELASLYAEIVDRKAWGPVGRPGFPGYSLPLFQQAYEYALDSDIDRQMLRHKGVIVMDAGPGSLLYLDAQQTDLNVQIMGPGAQSRIVLGPSKSLTSVFTCLGNETMMVFAGSPSEPIGLSADLINNKASMFVGAGGVCYSLRGTVEAENSIVIGDDCLISDQIELRGSDSHSIISIESGKVVNLPGSILIEPHVWLAQGVVVLKDVTIGQGSIIATCSVVTKNVPVFCLSAGVPAKVTKTAVSWQRPYPSSIADHYWQLGPDGFVRIDEPPSIQSGNVMFSAQPQVRAVIEAAYASILQRAADSDGLEHYGTRLRSAGLQVGTSEMITQLLASEERSLLVKKLGET